MKSDEERLYDDWKEFLKSDRPDVRLAAVDAVLQQQDDNGVEKLIQFGFLPLLAQNASYGAANNNTDEDDDDEKKNSTTGEEDDGMMILLVSVKALQALVHLTSHGSTANRCVQELLQEGQKGNILNRLLEIVLSSRMSPVTTTDADNNNQTNSRNHHRRSSIVNFAMSLLANLTRTERGAVDLVGRTLPEHAVPVVAAAVPTPSEDDDNNNNENDQQSSTSPSGEKESYQRLPTKPTIDLLLARFLNPALQQQEGKIIDYDKLLTAEEAEQEEEQQELLHSAADPYQHFASVLMNITQTEAGRRFLLKKMVTKKEKDGDENETTTTTILQKLLPQIRHPNPLRRRGVAGMIRNLCYLEPDSAWFLLNVVKIVKHILYPLAGPEQLDLDEKQGLHPDLWLEGPDKRREPDHLTRQYLVETILLLCTTGRASRQTLRLERVYVILKWLDMSEEHEDVSERILDIVNFLRRDEQGTEEGSSDKFVEEAYRKLSLEMLSSSSPEHVGSTNEDFDDVD